MVSSELEVLSLERPLSANGSNYRAIDYLEFYVGNAKQAAHFYRTAFGFTPIAYAGLETGVRDRVSYVLQQRNVRIVLTSALTPDGPIAEHVRQHGDGVKDIAFNVTDTVETFEAAVGNGAWPIMEPTVIEARDNLFVKAAIGAYGDTIHSFIQRDKRDGVFLPGYETITNPPAVVETGLSAIDHVAISVEKGQLANWVSFYCDVLGFHESHEENVQTEYSAMNSKVVQNPTGLIKFPMMEPADGGRRKSQIEEYLNSYGGPGAQHIALLSGDIIETVRALRANGIEFLRAPDSYYEMLEERIGELPEDLNRLREFNILVDRDHWGYLLQVFSLPLQSRPTVFMEVIQRKGARGFGGGNIKALFKALEREQARRGNL